MSNDGIPTQHEDFADDSTPNVPQDVSAPISLPKLKITPPRRGTHPNALPVDRNTIKLLYLAGVTPTDIAKQYHIKKTTVDKWVSRGKWKQEKDDQLARIEARVTQIEGEKQDIIREHMDALASECVTRIKGLKQMRTDSLMSYRVHAQALSTYDQVFRRAMGLGEGGNAQPRTLRLEIGRAPLPTQAPAPNVMEADISVVKTDT